MCVISATEFESTGKVVVFDISVFHALSAGKGMSPLVLPTTPRLAPAIVAYVFCEVTPDEELLDDEAPDEEPLDEDVLPPDELVEEEATCAAFPDEEPPPQAETSIAKATDRVSARPAANLDFRCFT